MVEDSDDELFSDDPEEHLKIENDFLKLKHFQFLVASHPGFRSRRQVLPVALVSKNRFRF